MSDYQSTAPANRFAPKSLNNYPQRGPKPEYIGEDQPTHDLAGVLDIAPEGTGVLRPRYSPSDKDAYVSSSQIFRFHMRGGDWVEGVGRTPKENERYWGLLRIDKINGLASTDPKLAERPVFDELKAVIPSERLELSTGRLPLSTRIIDLLSPIGKGQRGLIVSPPKAGKTTLLKNIAQGLVENYAKKKSKKVLPLQVMVVLIGERPEEVTDMEITLRDLGGGEVISSNFDESAENQAAAAEMTLERAKRLVEMGHDVVVLIDSITRLARAYNLSIPPSGRTLSGGFDPDALFPPKRFFGAARAFEKTGSLTIIGTCLVDTGSRMDDLIYEEFKGTGNMELHLTRKLQEKRVFPAIDISRSGTRHEEKLYDPKIYERIIILRRMVEMLGADERTEVLLERLKKFETNKEFLESLGKKAQ